jgi:glycosyltransferase involved in cell wall biosynthesis
MNGQLLVFNLRTDSNDSVLGFTTSWLRTLSGRFRRVHVVTLEVGETSGLPRNVHVYSLGKETGAHDLQLAWSFYRHVWNIIDSNDVRYAFAHMAPMFAVLAFPLLARRGIPTITWYTHPVVARWLPLAHRLSSAMVTFSRESYPLGPSDKVFALGHGIDTQLFCRRDYVEAGDPVISCVGRVSRAKRIETLVDAAALLTEQLGPNFRVAIVGDTHSSDDEQYRFELLEHIARHQLADIVTIENGLPMGQLPTRYWRSKVHVNLSRTGYGDKVALEAMACGRPSVVASDAFDETLGELRSDFQFNYGDARSLVQTLLPIVTAPPDVVTQLGAYLRDRVERLHDLDDLVDRLLGVMCHTSQ